MLNWLRSKLGVKPAGPTPRRLVVDGESVDDAADYLPLIAAIATITDGALANLQVTCDERGRARTLRVEADGRAWTATLEGATDWIDADGLLACLNLVIAHRGGARRLYAFSEEQFGQELGLIYAAPDELAGLRADGLIIEDPSMPDPQAPAPEEEVLATDRVIHGILVRAGARVEYWQEPPYEPMEMVLGHPQAIAGVTLPAGTHVLFHEDGSLLCFVTRAAARVGDADLASGTRVPFDDGRWRFDRAEGGCD